MIKVTIENEYQEQLKLNGNSAYIIGRITGLTPPKATVNTSKLATKDGSVFNSSMVNNRNIVFTIYPNENVETNRVNLYRYFKVKRKIKIYFTTKLRTVWIDGYIETVDGDLFENPQALQISVICPDPYFKALETLNKDIEQTGTEVANLSDEELGAVFELTATGAAGEITITNDTSGNSFVLATNLISGDKVTLNTRKGEKSIKLEREGTEINLINAIGTDTEWIQLTPGNNTISFAAESGQGNLTLSITIQPIYEGV